VKNEFKKIKQEIRKREREENDESELKTVKMLTADEFKTGDMKKKHNR
jgi:hypothetical protein